MEEVKNCLITEVHFSEDPEEMIAPIIAHAGAEGLKLAGTFYGKENTNYYVDGKRLGLYRVYAPIES